MRVITFESDKFAQFAAFVNDQATAKVYYRTVGGPTVKVFAVVNDGLFLARISDGLISDTDVTTAFPSAIELDCAVDARNEDIEPLLG